MSAPQSGPGDLSFRPATADDWTRVAQIVQDTWDDGDYIDQAIWNSWLSAPHSHLEAAIQNNEVVSFARLAELGPAEWWLDGVRVDREHRGQGIGRLLLAHMIDTFSEIGAGLLRFVTGSNNEAMTKLTQDFGFHTLISYAPMQAPAMPSDYRNFKTLQPQNLDLAYRYLRRSPMNRVNHFAEHHWTMYYITQERLSQYLANPDIQVLGWRDRDQLNGLAIIYPADTPGGAMRLGYMDGADDTTAYAMLGALQGIAAMRGFASVTWKMPLGIGLERRIGSTLYARRRDYDLRLFEKPLRA